ncbi:hypothetical protein BJ878DRAFT_540308 [Calycina marina]|uniref:Uncharacterized protein n=1 Tax=Calycina marina TaxID=1763456 RepID=A0A9P7Z6Q4_9HELO|nr:hypothetical protein BJ878DRAFT_540308 [Calycina marina]
MRQAQMCCDRLSVVAQVGGDPITIYTISVDQIANLGVKLRGAPSPNDALAQEYIRWMDGCSSSIIDLFASLSPVVRAFQHEDAKQPTQATEEFFVHRCSLVVQISAAVIFNAESRSATGLSRIPSYFGIKGFGTYAVEKLVACFDREELGSISAVTRGISPVLRLATNRSPPVLQPSLYPGTLHASIEDVADTWGGLEDIFLDEDAGREHCAKSVEIAGRSIIEIEDNACRWVDRNSFISARSFSIRDWLLID